LPLAFSAISLFALASTSAPTDPSAAALGTPTLPRRRAGFTPGMEGDRRRDPTYRPAASPGRPHPRRLAPFSLSSAL
jgi:hypothetical protein